MQIFSYSCNFAEEVRCTSKIKLALLAHERERFFAKCRQMLYYVTTALLKNCLLTVLQSLQIFIPQQLLQREMLFIIVVA